MEVWSLSFWVRQVLVNKQIKKTSNEGKEVMEHWSIRKFN